LEFYILFSSLKLSHTQTHTNTHTNTHKHTQTHTNTHKHTQTHTNTHKHTKTHTNTHKHTQTHTNTHIYGLAILIINSFKNAVHNICLHVFTIGRMHPNTTSGYEKIPIV